MEEYLLKVSDAAKGDVAKWLMVANAPAHLRLSTMAPLSAYGYPQGSEGHVLRLDTNGLTIGVPDDESIPRDFVPWANIAYVSDGTLLAAKQAEKK